MTEDGGKCHLPTSNASTWSGPRPRIRTVFVLALSPEIIWTFVLARPKRLARKAVRALLALPSMAGAVSLIR